MNIQTTLEDGCYEYLIGTKNINFAKPYLDRLNDMIRECSFYKNLIPSRGDQDWRTYLNVKKYRLCSIIHPVTIHSDIQTNLNKFVIFLSDLIKEKDWQIVEGPELKFSFNYEGYEGALVMQIQIKILTD